MPSLIITTARQAATICYLPGIVAEDAPAPPAKDASGMPGNTKHMVWLGFNINI
jgi:hypothetical protein